MKTVRVKREGLAEQLKKVRLFRHLKTDSLESVIDRAEFLRAEEGEKIIEEGTTDDRLYVLIDGSVSVSVGENNKDVYICTLGPGEVFGEAAMFANFQRTATVTAQCSATLLSMTRESFVRTLRDNCEEGLRVLFAMVHSLLSKLREVNMELAFERRDHTDQAAVDSLIDDLLGGS